MMRQFNITSFAGIDLGTWPGATPIAALNAMAVDAGYADHRMSCAINDEPWSNWTVDHHVFKGGTKRLLLVEVISTEVAA